MGGSKQSKTEWRPVSNLAFPSDLVYKLVWIGGNDAGEDGVRITVQDLMASRGVTFGTSGARGRAEDRTRVEAAFGDLCGELAGIDRPDRVRMVFANDAVVHLRPSGNAPEFRCYNEAGSPGRAAALNGFCL